MSKKKKPLPVLEDVQLEGNTSQGRSVARIEGKVIFVDGAVPGDTVDVQIYKKKSKYMEGNAIKIKVPSPVRVQPPCIHFGPCGGCKWQHLDYPAQLKFKEEEILQALIRIGGIDLPPTRPILGSKLQFRYRNKMDYAFGNSRWLTTEEIASGEEFERTAAGFHPSGRFNKIIDVQECLLQPEPSNMLRNSVRDLLREKGWSFYDVMKHEGFMRNLIVRNTLEGEFMAIFAFGEDDKEKIHTVLQHAEDNFTQLNTILYTINQKKNDSIYDLDFEIWKGSGYITEKMEDLSFRISPKAFYQTNPSQAYELYKVVREFASLTGNETVYDLYTGTGTIAAFVAKKAAKVVGVEFVEDAVVDARANAELNALTNMEFEAGDMKKILNPDFVERHGKPDVIITDPPRAGMDEPVVQTILELAPERIVYVSCNPATQARDLALMNEMYEVVEVQPVDMFPHTYHVENVVKLIKRK